MDADAFNRFRTGMRVASQRPIGWLSPGWPGIITNVFPIQRVIEVRFDHIDVARLVIADEIRPTDGSSQGGDPRP